MSSLGIYFGPKVISVVETKGMKVINNIQIPQSTISHAELEEKVPADVKMAGIVSLFREELRRNKIEAKEATLCLSGKDLIVRTFEIPGLPREELKSAINFEAKKYIPFKVEDLISDYQLKFDKISRSNLTLFIGIKKETLDRYISILSQLNIKINAIEYSAFSLARYLRITGAGDNKGIVGILGADLQAKDEVNFIVLENGFPLFSRDITLLDGAEQAGKPEEAEPATILEKLKTEIRVSLDYYHRKFSTKNIKKIFLFFNQDYHSEVEGFLMDLGLSVKFIDVNKHIHRPVPYSLNFVKGYSSSMSKAIKSNITVNLLAAKQKALLSKEKLVQKEAIYLLEGFSLDLRALGLGLLICAATFGWGLYRMQPLRQELNRVIGMRTQVTTVNPEASYKDLTAADSEYKRKLEALDIVVMKQLYVTEVLNGLPKAIPRGVWLANFSLNKEHAKPELTLEGIVDLVDSDKEFEAVNKFIANLEATPEFIRYFKEININSLDQKQVDQSTTATYFVISCKAR